MLCTLDNLFVQYPHPFLFFLYILLTYNPISIEYALHGKKFINRYCIATDLDAVY